MSRRPVRTLVVRCPDWPAVALGAVPEEPAVVVWANRVVAATPAARAQGVGVGMRRREAQGRCSHVVVHDRDLARERRVFEPVVRAVEAFTPRIELSGSGLCAFPTRGPARYFGGEQVLAAGIVDRVDAVLSELGWPNQVCVGIADGPFAACLASRSSGDGALGSGEPGSGEPGSGEPGSGDGAPGSGEPGSGIRVVEPGATAAFLAPLPIGVLEHPALTDVLVRLGLHTLGAFAELPASDVVGRFGLEGQELHRLARGLDEVPPGTRPPAPDLRVAVDLDPPAERVDTAAFAAKAAADDFHERLGALGLACTRVLVAVETEHGEVVERLWRHEGALGAGAVADRLRWQLDGWLNGPAHLRPSSGVARLVLAPDEVTAAKGRQLGFWGGESGSTDRAVRAIARVQGMLGHDAVQVPEWRGGRGPGERVVAVPASSIEPDDRSCVVPGALGPPWPGQVPDPAPATVHREPVPAEVIDRTGALLVVDGRGLLSSEPAELRLETGRDPGRKRGPWLPIECWAGPWPADERWWDHAGHRRRARLQIVAAGRAHLLVVERGRWSVEASYD